MRDVAVVGFAQRQMEEFDGSPTCVELLVPIFRELYEQTGWTRRDIGFWCSGSSDYLAGRSFSFVQAVDAIGVIPPVNESHVEMDAAWALYEAWVKIQTGEVDTALVYGFGKSSSGDLARTLALQLDPYLLAGLIRQESEFNPEAVSHAKAYGLTQVRPATGRLFARQAGVPRFTTRVLTEPAANLKIGCSILRSMLDRQGGSIEQTLASYNAGPNRVVEWLTWNTYREPAEFVESIPITETRDYVQAVLRNAAMYRRLYEGGTPR